MSGMLPCRSGDCAGQAGMAAGAASWQAGVPWKLAMASSLTPHACSGQALLHAPLPLPLSSTCSAPLHGLPLLAWLLQVEHSIHLCHASGSKEWTSNAKDVMGPRGAVGTIHPVAVGPQEGARVLGRVLGAGRAVFALLLPRCRARAVHPPRAQPRVRLTPADAATNHARIRLGVCSKALRQSKTTVAHCMEVHCSDAAASWP